MHIKTHLAFRTFWARLHKIFHTPLPPPSSLPSLFRPRFAGSEQAWARTPLVKYGHGWARGVWVPHGGYVMKLKLSRVGWHNSSGLPNLCEEEKRRLESDRRRDSLGTDFCVVGNIRVTFGRRTSIEEFHPWHSQFVCVAWFPSHTPNIAMLSGCLIRLVSPPTLRKYKFTH